MTTDRQYKKVVFICDGCGDTLETGVGDFREAVKVMRDERWEARPGTGRNAAWEHYCPTCG